MNILPVNLKQNKIHSNPAILKLKSKLELALTADRFSDSVNKDMLLISYANYILSLSLDEIAFKYGNNVRIPVAKYNLPADWDLLRNYKGIPGIYLFCNGKDSYLGSSKDLFTRCFTQHKNNAFTKKSIHKKFYSNVVKNTPFAAEQGVLLH